MSFHYFSAMVIASTVVSAAEASDLPQGLPPLIGSAVVRQVDEDDPQQELALTLPKDTWREIQPVMPKMNWPEPAWQKVRPGLTEGTMRLPMNDETKSIFCRFVDRKGKKLGHAQVRKQLSTKKQVLISVSGQIPHACYLRLPVPAELIVLLGPEKNGDTEKQAVAESKAADDSQIDLKDWGEQESQQYFFKLMQKGKDFKLKSKEAASKFLCGIWRLDRRAHIGGGHYVRADRGDDVILICTDEWLVVRLIDTKHARDVAVARLKQIRLDEKGHLRVTGKNPISFDHYQPLDKDHMAVLNYDFIAVVERIPCKTSEPAEDKAKPSSNRAGEKKADKQNENDAIKAAKAHLRALLTADKKKLTKSYAAKVRLLRRDKLLDREKVIDAAMKQFAGGGDVPDAVLRQILDGLKFESLEVTEGEFSIKPSASPQSKDEELQLNIKKGDAVIKMTQGRSPWFLQLRKANEEWTVVAEYTD